ncbi:MAG: SBBP repeat-containing protein [bacterium]|nr:SBBP repeat-containing protein [bacterium]
MKHFLRTFKICLSLLFVASPMLLEAQTVSWNKITGGSGLDYGKGIAVDNSGNSYTTGSFEGTVDFDPGSGTQNFTTSGFREAFFIQKLSRNGNYQMTLAAEQTGYASSEGTDIEVDDSGNIYVAGEFATGVDLDLSAGTDSYTDVSSGGAFLAKYTSAGAYEWGLVLNGYGIQKATDLAVDASGNVYLVGYFAETVDFDPSASTYELTSNGNWDAFVAKYNSSGGLVYAYQFGGTSNDVANSVAIDPEGDVYVVGGFRETVDFDPTAKVNEVTSKGNLDTYLMKLTSAGSVSWLNTWGSTSLDQGYEVVVATDGSPIVAATFFGTVDFDPSAGTSTLTSASSQGAIVSFNKSGTFKWVTDVGEYVPIPAFTIDARDNVHLAYTSSSNGNSLSRFSSTGDLIAHHSVGTNNGFVRGIAAEGDYVWVSGDTQWTTEFAFCGTSSTLSPIGSWDSYTARYSLEVPADQPTLSATENVICSTGSTTISISSGSLNDATSWEWYSGSCGGIPVGSGTSITVSPTATTTYYVRGEGYSCLPDATCASITIEFHNAPVSIDLDDNSAPEDLTLGGAIGNFGTVEYGQVTPNQSTSYVYSLVAGTGDTDNALFNIVEGAYETLESNTAFDFETKENYSIRVRSIDPNGCQLEDSFTINITDVSPEAPNDISLSNSTIAENEPVATAVGTFSSSDDDTGETFTYSLVAGTGDTDNASFSINGDQLETAESFDFETKDTYSIRVETDDNAGGTFEKAFTVTVSNVIESENDIISFTFQEGNGLVDIDTANHIVKIDAGDGVDRSSLTPNIIVSSSATVSPLTGVAQNFWGNVTYTVTAEDGTTQDWTIDAMGSLPGGTYYVKSGGDFSSLKQFMDRINNDGIAGDVIVEVTGNQDSNPSVAFVFYNHLGQDQYSVTLKADDTAAPFELTDALRLYGTKNFHVDGGDKMTIPNVLLSKTSATGNCQNITISNSIISTGVYPWWADNVVIDGNTFSPYAATTSTHLRAIYMDNGETSNITISNNFFHQDQTFNVLSSQSSTVAVSVSQDVGGYLRVFNNVIKFNPQSASNQYGIQVSYQTEDVEIYNNTISIEGSNSDYGTYAVGIYIGNTGQPTNSLKIKNNLIHMTPTLKTVAYNFGIWHYGTSIPTVEIDGNNITYETSGANQEGFMREVATIYNDSNEETMYSLFGTTTTEPNFTDATNLDFTLTGSSLSEADFRGVPVPYATEDYNGVTRSTTAPSKGAFESPNNITDIVDISFTGQIGEETIDVVNAEVNAQYPFGTDVSALSVNVTAFAGADVSPASGSTQDFSSGGVTYTVTAENSDTRDWTINLVPQNDAPTDISLSDNTIDENAGPFASVGNFSTTDLNVGQTHTYTLVAGTGDDDNATFSISGANLRAFGSLNYEAKDTYTIRVQTDDGAGGLYEEAMTITVNNVWEAPTDISITNFQLADENNAIDDELFTLSTADPDNGETYTYTLVAGTGDDDNASFSISGDKILAQDFFNHEVKESYTIRVETDDNNGFQFEKSFTIMINDLNDDPTEVQISSSSILEGNSINDVVGTLSTVDEDDADTYVYSLVSGTGSAGNASFNINGNELRASAVFDYETADSWVIRVRTDDQNGGIHDEVIFIDITNDPEAPTDISLSANTIAENNSVSDVIGTLSTTDPDNGETYTYTLVAGTGDDDNASFTISGDELQAGISFDHETKDTYSIRVRTDDGNSNQFEKSFSVTVTDINDTPTDIMLSSNEILEGNSINDIIGSLSSTDDDADTHVYSLVSGAGDDDNASFNVSGANLQASEVFDFETANSYSIRLRSDDQNGGVYEEVFSISVTNDPEAPTDIMLSANSILENNSIGETIGTLSTTDPDNGETFTYLLVTGTGDDDNASFSIVGDELRAAEQFDFETKSSYSVRIETNDGNGGTFEEAFSISISDEDPETVEWDGASWSNVSGPTSSDPVLFSGNYSGGFDGNDVEVLTGVTVTVTAGNTADIAGDVNNQGSIIVESGATMLTYETGIVSGNNIIVQRNTRYSDGKYSFVGSPVEQSATVTGSDLGSYVYKYDESVSWGSNEGLGRWVSASADELVPGQGYTQAHQQLIEFSGVPNTGSVTYNGTYTGTYNDGTNESTEGWNLVANPYAAAISVSDFLTENTNNTGAVYFWDDNGSDVERGDNADYVVANGIAATNTTPAGGESRFNLHIGSSQGFFVQLASDIDTDVIFTEAMRVSGNNGDGAFFRTESVPLTRLNLTSNNGLFKQAVIGWVEEAASNIDRRFDAPIFDATLPASVYTVKNNQALAIQGAGLSDEMVSVGVNIPEDGVYSISVELEDHESTTILWDKVTDTKVDITYEAYEFSSHQGIFTDRFVILKESVITSSSLSLSESVVYSYQNQVFIKNVEGLSVDYQIFSLKGDKVWSGKVEGSRELLLNVPEGIYMVTDGATSWKVLLNNN